MLRRYELTDEEWNRIAPLLPPKNTGKQGRPRKDTRTILNGMVQLARSGAPWRDLLERYGSWQTVYSRFRKWIDDGILDNIFRTLSLEAELEDVPAAAADRLHEQHGRQKNGKFAFHRFSSSKLVTYNYMLYAERGAAFSFILSFFFNFVRIFARIDYFVDLVHNYQIQIKIFCRSSVFNTFREK